MIFLGNNAINQILRITGLIMML